MIKASVEELLEKVPCVFKLVILAARRTFELNEGAPSLIDAKFEKTLQVALEEIKAGKVTYKMK